MRLPFLFRQIHGDAIFSAWMKAARPSFVNVIPQEPLGRVSTKFEARQGDFSVTIVKIRCWNERGVMQCEAATSADLKIIEEWCVRHRDTPPEDFKWYPNFQEPQLQRGES